MSHVTSVTVPTRTADARTEEAVEAPAAGLTTMELQAIRDQYEDRLRASEQRREEVEFRARQALSRLTDALDALKAMVGDDDAALRRPLACPSRARA